MRILLKIKMKLWSKLISITACLTLLVGCAEITVSNKPSISPDEFERCAIDNGLEIQDYGNDMQESLYDEFKITDVIVAVGTDTDVEGIEVTYAIEYYRFEDNVYALSYYNDSADELYNRIKQFTTNSYSEQQAANWNTGKYNTSVSTTWLTRIDNTLIYSDVFNTNISAPSDFLESIGYR